MGEAMKSLLGMDREELSALASEAGEPSYRAKQIMQAVYRQRVESLEEISTLPLEFRERLEQNGVTVGAARTENKFVSSDGTVRYLIGFADGQSVETVWMPEGDGGEAGDGSEAGDEAESGSSTSGAKAQVLEEGFNAGLEGLLHPAKNRTDRNRTGQNRTGKDRGRPGRSTICISSQVGCA